MKDRVYLYDTTLRDGGQTIGVNFLLPDKKRIVAALDELGIDYIEAGFPGSNPVDSALFEELPATTNSQVTAFGMTKRVGYSISNDPGFQEVLRRARGAVCIVAKSSEYHVHRALGISNDENLALIRESLQAIVSRGHEAFLNCEHFFDGYKANSSFTKSVVDVAIESGARWVTLCDTNGGILPDEVSEIVADICRSVPGERLGIHTHNDTEQAVANSIAAVRAGCRLIHGTMNGLGERCGNANLTTLIPTMILKKLLSDRYTVGISETKLTELTAVSRIVDEVLGRTPYAQAPYVGVDAFATKAGIHASAILKEPATYEHVEPSKVGNQRRIFVASQAGRSNVLAALDRLGIDVNADDDKVSQVVENVKRAEAHGVAYDLAQATLDLEILETFGRRKTRGLELVEIASRQVPAKQWSHLSVQARSHDSTAPAQIETEGADLFDLATQAVLGFYPSYASVVRSLDLTLISLRFVSTGSEHLWRAIVEGKDKGLSQPWRTLAIGQSVIEVYLKAVDSCCCYRIESVQ